MVHCLLTIHGIGFQTDNYANPLHQHLRQCHAPLSTDTPIYLIGHWLPELGELERLGVWDSQSHRTLTYTKDNLGVDG